MNPMGVVIQAEALTKYHGKVVRVNNLGLSIPEGEMYGFLTLNGSGNTATIHLLYAFLRPKASRATILDLNV